MARRKQRGQRNLNVSIENPNVIKEEYNVVHRDDTYEVRDGVLYDISKEKINPITKSDKGNSKLKDPFYKCCCCGTRYAQQQSYFGTTKSPFFLGNNGYLPICYKCLDDIEGQYERILGSSEAALKRIALHFDLYISDNIIKNVKNTTITNSKMKNYIRLLNVSSDNSRTYDDYLRENQGTSIRTVQDLEIAKKNNEFKIPQKTVNFFGLGYSEEEYMFLQNQYQDWTKRHVCETKAQEELFKNLCIAQLNINLAQQRGGKVAEAMKTFQDLLGSANLKPAQNNDNVLADTNTFGTLIKKWEDTKPISDPDPEWEDVDGIVRYINIYFLGHLCKMMGIKNNYARMYEEEMSKYRVEKPEYEGDDEALFDSVFGNDFSGDA